MSICRCDSCHKQYDSDLEGQLMCDCDDEPVYLCGNCADDDSELSYDWNIIEWRRV